MGRRPNPLISQWFHRGTKLADNSNRYPHTCKACGENFPKGRIDSLTSHLTKKCPAISEQDRVEICFALHNIPNPPDHLHHAGSHHQAQQQALPGTTATASPITSHHHHQQLLNLRLQQEQLQLQHQNQHQHPHHQSLQPIEQHLEQQLLQQQPEPESQNWTALQTLAEVSRHISANDKPEEHSPSSAAAADTAAAAVAAVAAVAAAAAEAVATTDPTEPTTGTTTDPTAPVITRPAAPIGPVVPGSQTSIATTFADLGSPFTTVSHPAIPALDDFTQAVTEAPSTPAATAAEHVANINGGGEGDGSHNDHIEAPTIQTEDALVAEPAHQDASLVPAPKGLTPEEEMQLLQAVGSVDEPSSSHLTIAAAAAAAAASQVNTPLFNDHLLTEEAAVAATAAAAAAAVDVPAVETPTTIGTVSTMGPSTTIPAVSDSVVPAAPQPPTMSSMTSTWLNPQYTADGATIQAATPILPIPNHLHGHTQMVASADSIRVQTGTLNGNRVRHSRARFEASRRKQVQAVRKKGACMRCRILRKSCSDGDPCDACRKVLHPRVWEHGCIRTKLIEQLDLYFAGVHAVYSQNNINQLQRTKNTTNLGTVVEVAHFPDTQISMTVKVIDSLEPRPRENSEQDANSPESQPGQAQSQPEDALVPQVAMIDFDQEDITAKMDQYVTAILDELINVEPSTFARVTLQTAQQIVHNQDTRTDPLYCPLLATALTLWGFIEVMDRERQWAILEKRAGAEPQWMSAQAVPYSTICLQLSAAAERKANTSSRSLMGGMQRKLQDSKVPMGFPMYLTCMILLLCVEKSTWAFMAWEQDKLRPLWPLGRDPGSYTTQGKGLSEMLKMLLGIRRALSKTYRPEHSDILATTDPDPAVQAYFNNLQLNVVEIEQRLKEQTFSPTDSRSLELTFCSVLLLPNPSPSAE